MKIDLSKLWDSLHSSFWFIPTLMVAVAIASIAVLIYFIDHAATSIQAQHVIAAVDHEPKRYPIPLSLR